MKLSRPALYILAFCATGLVWRGAFLPFARGMYTDGILQVECFRYGMSYWPPLYAVLARATGWVFGLEGGARLASMVAGAAVAAPLCAIGRRMFGLRAAFWAMAAWVASPMALRWSVAVMTDMTMLAFWTGALGALAVAAEKMHPALFPDGENVPAQPRQGMQWLLLANMLAALATLTRHQGILLLPILGLAAWKMRRAAPRAPLALFIWIIVPLWVVRGGIAPLANHFAQFGQRSGGAGAGNALLHVYWTFFESFIAASPYFFTYGIFGFMLFGLLRTNWAPARLRAAGWIALYLTISIFVLQSAFSSFQERYLMPLLPIVCLFAGHGMATWERKAGAGSIRFWGLAAPSLMLGLAMGALTGVYQGSPFDDIRQAAEFIRDEVKPGSEQRIITNETYNPQIAGVKVNYWSGGQPTGLLRRDELRAGDIILISSYCEGSPEAYRMLVESLSGNPAIEMLHAPFASTIIPFFPDIMYAPYHQNPMAWNLRYRPVQFQTVVLRARNLAEERLQAMPPIDIPRQGRGSAGLEEELKGIVRQVDALSSAGRSQ